MKTSTLLIVALFVVGSFTSSAFAQNAIDTEDHFALAKHYENEAKEIEVKLQENKAALEEYEDHSFYYGRQGQDVQSHTTANIREYEKQLSESLNNADLHKRLAMEQQNNAINKAKLNVGNDSSAIR